MTIRHYHFRMAKRNISPPFWARRLKDHMEQTGQTLANLAKKMRNHNSGEELVESTLRSWTNGHRKINLEDFIELCIQAKADPAVILFGRPLMTADVAEKVGDLMVELQRYSPSAPAPGLATNDAPRPAGSASVGKSKSARSSSKIHK